MAADSLARWLGYLERLDPHGVRLGLERVAAVRRTLGARRPAPVVVTVAGTNGKGSVVRLLEAMLGAAGYRVGAYTSPHLLRYTERVRVDGAEANAAALSAAFARVQAARGDTPLTYFEFGTLAALELFADAALDVALLEVGLGGRLDAVNVVDPDVAVVTSVDVDHTDWLGTDRTSIGREKAGVFRGGRPAVCGDVDPPASLMERAADIGAHLTVAGRDFDARDGASGWYWRGAGRELGPLPQPRLERGNAVTALAALSALAGRVEVPDEAIARGLVEASLPGRFQVLPGVVPVILDVAHNPAATRRLAARLRARTAAGATRAVAGMLADKDLCGTLAPLVPLVDAWYPATPEVARAADPERLADCLREAGATVQPGLKVGAALAGARAASRPGDRVVVFGSFYTVAEALASSV